MAQRTQVILTCDVHDGAAEAVETVAFTVEGQSYECELCEPHLLEFREAMEIWSSHSRPAGSRSGSASGRSGRGGRRRSAGGDGPTPSEIREWARSQGLEVSARGRVSSELHAAYEAAH
jgi:hypothetical protein